MHDALKSFKYKPNQKILRITYQFWKTPKIFSTTPKVRSKIMKCMIKSEKASYQMKNKDLKTEKNVRKMKRLSFGCLGEGEILFCHERSGRNKTEIAWILFIGTLSISMDWEVSRIKACVLFVEELSRICWEVSTTKGSRWIEVAIEHPESFLMDQSSYRKAVENVIKRSWRVSIDSLVVERYRA